MSKFLKLVQENTPGEEDGRGPYTVEYKDSRGNVMARLTIRNDVGSSYDNFLDFAKVTNGDLEVESKQPVEDQETETANTTKDVELAAATAKKGVSGAIAGAMGTVAQKAKKAVERRKKVIKAQLPKKIAEYEAATNELEK
jgi:hypothetical protein|tara:strand:+ start:45 stop:467 length:423 start_codon:yes stop_codon:yes gene_type:complete